MWNNMTQIFNLTLVGETDNARIMNGIGPSTDNLCRHALIAGQCNGEDLSTECINMCKKRNVKCMSHRVPNAKEQVAIKKAVWNKNDKEIRTELDKSDKVRSILIPTFKKEINYLKRMILPDTRIWFRYIFKIHI